MATCFGQPDAARVAIEKNDAKVFLKRPDPLADTRLAGAEHSRCAMEAEILGYGQCLDQGDHWKAPATQKRMLDRRRLLYATPLMNLPATHGSWPNRRRREMGKNVLGQLVEHFIHWSPEWFEIKGDMGDTFVLLPFP